MVPIEKLARIAEIEFSDIVDTTELIGTKLRIMLTKEGFIDVWLSRKLANRLWDVGLKPPKSPHSSRRRLPFLGFIPARLA